jgi:hypothetical protein
MNALQSHDTWMIMGSADHSFGRDDQRTWSGRCHEVETRPRLLSNDDPQRLD